MNLSVGWFLMLHDVLYEYIQILLCFQSECECVRVALMCTNFIHSGYHLVHSFTQSNYTCHCVRCFIYFTLLSLLFCACVLRAVILLAFELIRYIRISDIVLICCFNLCIVTMASFLLLIVFICWFIIIHAINKIQFDITFIEHDLISV